MEAITLLKNTNDFLPLPKDKKLLVTGVGAHSFNYLNGAWTRTWSGEETKFNDEGKKTVLEGIQDKIGSRNVTYVEGTNYNEDINTIRAVQEARKVDFVVVVLGEKPATEKPSDIEDLTMPESQLELVRQIAKTGKPIVLVLLEARPRIISQIEPLVESILMAYLPGSEGGRAIADVLFGDFNPCGKLPITYPRHTGSIWAYDHTKADARDGGFGFEGFNPQYEFGYGLSYTNFKYDNLTLNQDTFTMDEPIKVSIDVTNSGNTNGKEVVQLYTSDLVASIVPAVKQLQRFQKLEITPGTTKK